MSFHRDPLSPQQPALSGPAGMAATTVIRRAAVASELSSGAQRQLTAF
jgi:hypothetical protein